jgi:hypothetical protein
VTELLQHLSAAARKAVPEIDWNSLRLLAVDFEEDGRFGRFAGLAAAAEALHSASSAGTPLPGIVLIGLHDKAQAIRPPAETGWILDWPGCAYLKMPFSAEKLRDTASQVLNGRLEHLPAPCDAEVLAHIKNILHWFERVKQGQAGTARIFADVERGRLVLTDRILAPAVCLSDRQQRAFENLFVAMRARGQERAGTLASDAIRVQLRELEDASCVLEQLKTNLRNGQGDAASNDLQALSHASDKLVAACAMLYHAMTGLEEQLGHPVGGKDG